MKTRSTLRAHGPTRRELLQLGSLAGAGVALGACSPVGGEASPEETATPTDMDDGEPRPGGTLVVATANDVIMPDPTNLNPGNQIFVDHVYDKLARWDQNYEMVNELAENLESSPDGVEWTIELRQGVTFHNGREMTADDLEWNILRLRDPDFQGFAFYPALSNLIDQIEKLDDHTVRLVLHEPTLQIQNLFFQLRIADRETIEGPDSGRVGVGTGPFAWEEWVPGQRLRLVRNENYWKEGLPYLDGIETQIVGDPEALRVQLEANQAQMAERLSLRDAAALQEGDQFEILPHEATSNVMVLMTNLTDPQMQNKRIRQAINYAIDRERIAQSVTAGFGSAAAVVWPEASPAFDQAQSDSYGFDLDRARSLLDDAGVDELTIPIHVWSNFPELVAAAEIFRNDLSTIGVTLDVHPEEPARMQELLVSRDYEGMASNIPGGPPFPAVYMAQTAPITHDAEQNYAGYDNDEYAELLESALDPSIDDGERLQLIKQATDILLDESFVMPIATLPVVFGMNTSVRGAYFDVPPIIRLDEAWLET